MAYNELAGLLSRAQTPAELSNPFRYSNIEDIEPTEQELIDLQDQIGAAGAERGGAYAIPSRESLKESAFGQVRRLLGLQAREAEAKALPERVRGEYGLEAERIRGRAGVEASRYAAERQAAVQQAIADRMEQTQRAIAGRTIGTQGEISRRQEVAEQGRAGRLQAAEGLRRATALEKIGKRGPFGRLGEFFGLVGPSDETEQAALLRQQAEQILATAPEDEEDFDITPEEAELVRELLARVRGGGQ